MWSPKVTLQVKEKLDGEPDLLTPFRAPQFFFTGVPWFQMPVRPAPAGLFFFPEPPFRVGGGKALLLPPQRESRDEQTLTASSGLCPGPCAPHCPPVPCSPSSASISPCPAWLCTCITPDLARPGVTGQGKGRQKGVGKSHAPMFAWVSPYTCTRLHTAAVQKLRAPGRGGSCQSSL